MKYWEIYRETGVGRGITEFCRFLKFLKGRVKAPCRIVADFLHPPKDTGGFSASVQDRLIAARSFIQDIFFIFWKDLPYEMYRDQQSTIQ